MTEYPNQTQAVIDLLASQSDDRLRAVLIAAFDRSETIDLCSPEMLRAWLPVALASDSELARHIATFTNDARVNHLMGQPLPLSIKDSLGQASLEVDA